MFGSVENLPNEDKRNIVNAKLDYLAQTNMNSPNGSSHNLGKYEMALKRRHGAKKLMA